MFRVVVFCFPKMVKSHHFDRKGKFGMRVFGSFARLSRLLGWTEETLLLVGSREFGWYLLVDFRGAKGDCM